MAEKTIQVRVLVEFHLDGEPVKPNQVVTLPAGLAAYLKENGSVDDDRAAVAYCLKANGN